MSKFQTWKNMVPYGQWTCEDGREVLFNRQYWPILERTAGSRAKAASPGEHINFIEEQHFFAGADSPWAPGAPAKDRNATLRRINKALKDWGLPDLPSMPPRSKAKLTALRSIDSTEIAPRQNPWSDLLQIGGQDGKNTP